MKIHHRTTAPDPVTGQRDPNGAYAYTAQMAEVLVDTHSGQVKIEKICCAIDVGKAINLQQVIGQIQSRLLHSVLETPDPHGLGEVRKSAWRRLSRR